MPINLGAAAIAAQAIAVAYGAKYSSAIPVMAIAAVLAIPRAFQNLPETLLRTADRQATLLRMMLITGIVNVALDVPLILRYGAIGAAIGNGVSQTIGVLLLWRAARSAYHFDWPFAALFRFMAAAGLMAAAAFLAARPFPPAIGLAVGISTAAPLYLIAVRLFRAFEPEDLTRLTQVSKQLPGRLRPIAVAAFRFAVGDDRGAAPAAGYTKLVSPQEQR
jgi:O-antigen/teichoic acid export membrane protein